MMVGKGWASTTTDLCFSSQPKESRLQTPHWAQDAPGDVARTREDQHIPRSCWLRRPAGDRDGTGSSN
eukprot:7335858-Pyramimonas_sp.AAC.1